mmetsp:Transcript_86514/g.231911  ORF Transcript_86514/g.231911 Transcript_86514/m.231911 type:complete len:788 (+) Transcript_86514:206-2569(+)
MTYFSLPEMVDMGPFEGPEKTVTICFKPRRMSVPTLRQVPKGVWDKILEHAKCEILSVVDSTTMTLAPIKEDGDSKAKKRAATKGITGYMLSESSLFLGDYTVTLKTCGTTTPLAALQPLLDEVVPSWRQKGADRCVKFVTFARLGYMFPKDQIDVHVSWEKEVEYLQQFFDGVPVVLGSKANAEHHVYVANYLGPSEVVDHVITQVALTGLTEKEAFSKFVGGDEGDRAAMQRAWKALHPDATLDQWYFDPVGYSANAVAGAHYTTIHATPQPASSYVSVETTMPLGGVRREEWLRTAAKVCEGDTLDVFEFCMTPQLLPKGRVEIPGFQAVQRSECVTETFACCMVHYTKEGTAPAPRQRGSSSVQSTPEIRPVEEEMQDGFELDHQVPVLPAGPDATLDAAVKYMQAHPGDSPTAMLDLAALTRQAEQWRRLLPRVEPFYAVKCNPQAPIVQHLWDIWQRHGGGFDCATPSEMKLVKDLGIPMDRVVYANPCKQVSALEYSKEVGVNWVVFDNEAELKKIKTYWPEAKVVLRVQTDDTAAQCPLSNKFGAAPTHCEALLRRALDLGLHVTGVSFHVGSGCSEFGAFRGALHRARGVFDVAERLGLDLELLDIGGGFPGWDAEGEATFADHAADIREVLDGLFPDPKLRVIAEPGRYFVAEAQALLCTVNSVADASTEDQAAYRYYLNDGVYGSFNCLVYDHASVPEPRVLRKGVEVRGQALACTLFGPTCDGFDMISEKIKLPVLEVGDRLVFPNMGAYTSAACTTFNGFSLPQVFVYSTEQQG